MDKVSYVGEARSKITKAQNRAAAQAAIRARSASATYTPQITNCHGGFHTTILCTDSTGKTGLVNCFERCFATRAAAFTGATNYIATLSSTPAKAGSPEKSC